MSLTQPPKNIEEKVKKSLIYSRFDGLFNGLNIGFGESFFSAFAVFLKATNFQLGLLGSLPMTLGYLSQLFSNRLIRLSKSRKKFVYMSALFEGLMYIPIALVFFLGTLKVYHLILFVSLYWVFGTIYSPAWSSWMGELVKEEKRGSYFGKRTKLLGFASFASLLIGGYILQQFGGSESFQYIGFALIFCLALICRAVSIIFLIRKYEPKYTPSYEAEFSLVDFIKDARKGNLGLFTLYLCFMNFALFLAGPFFAAYMLYDLKLDYFTFTIIIGTSLIVKYIAMPVWGKAADRYGTRKVLSLTGYLITIVPLLWLFSGNIFYLIAIQIYSGLIWAGFEISSFNFIFDTTTSEKRATSVAYYHALNGIAILLGALAGSFIVKYNALFWSKYLLVFLLSFVFRFITSVVFIPMLKEVRAVQDTTYQKLFMDVVATMPTVGLIYNNVIVKKKDKLDIKIKREDESFADKISALCRPIKQKILHINEHKRSSVVYLD